MLFLELDLHLYTRVVCGHTMFICGQTWSSRVVFGLCFGSVIYSLSSVWSPVWLQVQPPASSPGPGASVELPVLNREYLSAPSRKNLHDKLMNGDGQDSLVESVKEH